MGSANEQQPGAPYAPNSLNVHDERLRFAKEFTTNTTADVGDAFTTTAAPTADPPAAIDARFGMLNLAETNPNFGEVEPRGRTYLLPEWDTFTEQPELGAGAVGGVLFCRLLVTESNDADTAADLILAPEAMVGNQPALPFMLASVFDNGDPYASDAFLGSWLDGPSGPAQEVDINAGVPMAYRALYFRMIIFTDNVSETEVNCDISNDGETWSHFANAAVDNSFVVRRVGLALRGAIVVALDWMRLYDLPEIVDFESGFIPVFADGAQLPVTGSRQYIP